MQRADIFPTIIAFLILGGGLYLSTFPTVIVQWIGIIIMAMAFIGMALWLDLRPQLVEHKLSNIPISFTMRQTGFCTGRAGLGNTLENDALAFVFGPVLVANTSSTNRVILDFTLLVNGSDGTHLKILSRVRDGYGRIYGQKAAETRRKHGLETPIYLISPVEIDPQKSVQGKLAFIYGPVGEGPMTEFVKNSFSHDYEYTLVVSDKISTTSVELKMPWEYPTH